MVVAVVITQNENGECDVIQLKRKKPMLCYVVLKRKRSSGDAAMKTARPDACGVENGEGCTLIDADLLSSSLVWW